MGKEKTKVIRREYSRGQWRRPKSYDGSTIVGRSLQQQQQQLKPSGRSISAGTPGASSGRGYIKSRGVVTRTPRRGWLCRRSSEGETSAQSVISRMVVAWSCAPLTSKKETVRE